MKKGSGKLALKDTLKYVSQDSNPCKNIMLKTGSIIVRSAKNITNRTK